MTAASTARIRALNDALRAEVPFATPPNMVLCTVGVSETDNATKFALFAAIRSFAAFKPDNDPWQEHDFGAIELAGTRYFWKIDYYDLAMKEASPDPADPAVTARVLTVMQAAEY